MYDDDKPIDPEWQKECMEMEKQVDIEFQCYKPEFSEEQQKVIDNTAQKLLENIAFCEQHQELFIPKIEGAECMGKSEIKMPDGSFNRYLEKLPVESRATGRIVEKDGKMVIKDLKITSFGIVKPESSK